MIREGVVRLPFTPGSLIVDSALPSQIALAINGDMLHVSGSTVLTSNAGRIVATWSPGDSTTAAEEFGKLIPQEFSASQVTADGTVTLQFADGSRLVVLPDASGVETWYATGRDWSVRCEPTDPDVFVDVSGELSLPGGGRRLSGPSTVAEFRDRLRREGKG